MNEYKEQKKQDNTTLIQPIIGIIGVGGAGGNAVNNMIANNLEGCRFIVANTDSQALNFSNGDVKIQLGKEITRGLGAGSRPDIGKEAAVESKEEIEKILQGLHMLFVTAGMGGGTGTGASTVIASIAKEMGILTIGVVTKPFQFEGNQRMQIAEKGIDELVHIVDTLIIIPNQNLFRISDENTSFQDAFSMADNVLYNGIRSVVDLMLKPGMINLDFSDIRSIMQNTGLAMMGTGEAEGSDRATHAAENAVSNPLLDNTDINTAKNVLISITGSSDMKIFEVEEATNYIRNAASADAIIIFGCFFDETLEEKLRISVIAAGLQPTTINEQKNTQSSAKKSSIAWLNISKNIQKSKNVENDPAPSSEPLPEPVSVQPSSPQIKDTESEFDRPDTLKEFTKNIPNTQETVQNKEKSEKINEENEEGIFDIMQTYENDIYSEEDPQLSIPTFLRKKGHLS